jgi:Xaa-Pro aminopeptidase
MLDDLPGARNAYSGWQEQAVGLQLMLSGARRVAMQYSQNCAIPYVSMVDAGTVELVRSMGVEVVSSAELIQFFEARWSETALESHLEAGRRVDEIRRNAFQRIGQQIKNGGSAQEYEIKTFILESFAGAGLVTDHGPIVAVNGNAANPHYEPAADTSRPIRPGDFVLIDLWAKLDRSDSVYYDITWTGFCGTAPPEQIRNVFGVVRDARDLAISRVQKAVSSGQALRGFEVDDAARGFIESEGYGRFFTHRTGHSIGVDVHGNGANMDNLETHDERPLIPRTCFSIEPGIYLDNFGVRSEVNVYIGDDAARVTGEIQNELVLI